MREVMVDMLEFSRQRPAQGLFDGLANLSEPLEENLFVMRIDPPLRTKGRCAKFGRERVRYEIDRRRLYPGKIQAETNGKLRKDVRIVRPRLLAMFDAIKTLLLASRYDLAVNNQRCGGFVKDRVYSENIQAAPSTPATDVRIA